MIKFTKTQIDNAKKTKAGFREHMKDSNLSTTSGLRHNGELIEPQLIEITDGKTSMLYTVIGKARINNEKYISVQTAIKTEKDTRSSYIDIDLDTEILEYKVKKGSLSIKK